MIVLGLLSGTSADGIDAAAADLRLDGDSVLLRPLGARTTSLPQAAADALAAVLPPASADAKAFCVLDTLLGRAFADAAVRADAELCAGKAELVVSHGQTVYHWVEGRTGRGTLQLGQPAFIAEATGRPVVADLRARDVAAGGHGAPLTAVLDRLLFADDPRTLAALNLGGVANATIVAGGVVVSAFDTGPGNALIDAAARMTTGQARDHDGAGAASGRVHPELFARLLDDPYYHLVPPKTTGRERFNAAYLRRHVDAAGLGRPGGAALPTGDLLATVTELTARTVSDALGGWGVEAVVLSGGGTRNATLLGRLRGSLPRCAFEPVDRWGIPAEHKEAYLFALLGFLSVCGVPGTDPAATGAARPTVLGSLTPPHARLPVPRASAPPPRRLRVIDDRP